MVKATRKAPGRKKKSVPKKYAQRLSLYDVGFVGAVDTLLATPPEKKPTKKNARRKSSIAPPFCMTPQTPPAVRGFALYAIPSLLYIGGEVHYSFLNERDGVMNAMQKVAWTELGISMVAVAVVAVLFPFLGSRATYAFALLGLVALSVVFLRRRGDRVVVDERDREIEKRATRIAVNISWMTLITVLAVANLWSNYSEIHAVSSKFLNWLIWSQFALVYGIKGLAAVVLYQRQQHAA